MPISSRIASAASWIASISSAPTNSTGLKRLIGWRNGACDGAPSPPRPTRRARPPRRSGVAAGPASCRSAVPVISYPT